MNRIKHKALMRVMATSAMLIVCGYFIQPGFAGEGDSPLEAFFLPIDTEVTGIIGADYMTDYYTYHQALRYKSSGYWGSTKHISYSCD